MEDAAVVTGKRTCIGARIDVPGYELDLLKEAGLEGWRCLREGAEGIDPGGETRQN
jgi:hypothetical protein